MKGKKLLALLIAVVLVLAMCSCSAPKTGGDAATAPTENASGENTAAPTEGATPEETAANTPAAKMTVDHTTAFSVQYLENDVKLVTDAENQQFLLVPKTGEVPAGYDTATVIRTPVENALFCSSTQVGMMHPYGNMAKYVVCRPHILCGISGTAYRANHLRYLG